MARALSAPSNLPSLVKTTFAKALSGGDLHYFPTKVTVLPVNSVPVSSRPVPTSLTIKQLPHLPNANTNEPPSSNSASRQH